MDGVEFDLRGTTYRVRLNARARYLFERGIGYPVQNLRSFDEVVSDVEELTLLWAALEGNRLAERRVDQSARAEPWTLDEVIALVDDATAAERKLYMDACAVALRDAFGGLEPADEEGADAGKATPTG